MSKAYGLLGILFVLVLGGAYLAYERAEAPSVTEEYRTDRNLDDSFMTLTLSSPAFGDNEMIPSKYTCDGENTNPELRISGVPEGTISLVLVMDDPDIPASIKESRGIEKFDHWVLYNIDPSTRTIAEGESVDTAGVNGRGDAAYTGPCPPDNPAHRYFFRLYALSGTLNFIKAPTLDEVETAAQSMMIGSAELVGRYQRQR